MYWSHWKGGSEDVNKLKKYIKRIMWWNVLKLVHLSGIGKGIIYRGIGFEFPSGHLDRQKRISVTKSQNKRRVIISILMSVLIIYSRHFCYKTKDKGKYINFTLLYEFSWTYLQMGWNMTVLVFTFWTLSMHCLTATQISLSLL